TWAQQGAAFSIAGRDEDTVTIWNRVCSIKSILGEPAQMPEFLSGEQIDSEISLLRTQEQYPLVCDFYRHRRAVTGFRFRRLPNGFAGCWLERHSRCAHIEKQQMVVNNR